MKPLVKALAGTAIVCAILLAIVFTFAIVKLVWPSKGDLGGDHVAVVELKGVILSATELLREVREITDEETAKALVVRIDSPGGLVAPSQEFYEAFLKIDKKIPVVVSMASVAASGGYYAALGGRRIYANAGTLTASIGVIMEFANTSGLYQWAKIDRYTLKAGKLKDIGSTLRPMTAEEREVLNGMLRNIHEEFRGAVRARRKLDGERLDQVTDGRILTGKQALEAGLVDAIGTLEDAVAEAKKLAGLKEDAHVRYPEEKKGFVEKLLLGHAERSVTGEAGRLLEQVLRPGGTGPWGTDSPRWQVLLMAQL